MEFPPLDFSKIRTYPVRERANKVSIPDFGKVHQAGAPFRQFLDSLPRFLVANDLLATAQAIATARKNGKTVLLMMGAHPIKCGLNPILTEAMRSGIVSAVAFNGAGAIHDFELAYNGATSEDVQSGLDDGSFGMIEETPSLMNAAMAKGVAQGIGAGKALGEAIVKADYPNRTLSILATGVESRAPVTVHIAVGTDIIHQHPSTEGAVLGEASYLDFKTLASVIATLEGGVVLNIGSAVIMPEVFLKALTVARNLGHQVDHFVTATFDMIRQYRPTENVTRRPTQRGGKGYYIIGHHEIMIPLLFAAVKEYLC